MAEMDPRVAAIRADKAIGHGTCSVVDECYEDTEIIEALNKQSIMMPHDAVRWAREIDGLHWENGTNCCSGEAETDDRLRAMSADSRERNALPIEV